MSPCLMSGSLETASEEAVWVRWFLRRAVGRRRCGSEGSGRAGGEVNCKALSTAAVASYPHAGAGGGRGFPLP